MRRLLILLSFMAFAVATVCAAKTRPCTVTLMDSYTVYKKLTEPSAKAGVTLPNLPNMQGWTFIGWTESEDKITHTRPTLWAAGQLYHPEKDCSLWALYRHIDEACMGYQQEIRSGTYLYVNDQSGKALYGVPNEDGTMQASTADITDKEQYFFVDFTSDTTAYISHVATKTPIGHKGLKMAAEATLWRVHHDGEEMIFFTKVDNKTYVLWLDVIDPTNSYTYAGLYPTENLKSPMRLMKVPSADEIIYSNHPEDTQAIEAPRPDMPAQTLRIGNYELRIENGKKHLRVIQ